MKNINVLITESICKTDYFAYPMEEEGKKRRERLQSFTKFMRQTIVFI